MRCQERGNDGERRNEARKGPEDALMGGEGSGRGIDGRGRVQAGIDRREGSRRRVDGRERV